jgi:alkylation response protein AidB-like acyl-CoA dehydrogenase/acyl carrier protein
MFVSGRLKDLIIVRGANHYPQDIEWTVERSHAAFRPGCSAAFSIEEDGTEQVVVVAELEREYLRGVDSEELARNATRAVAEEHELHLRHLVLLKTGTVSRTTSGKIQRSKCRTEFLTGQLDIVWATPGADVRAAAAPPPAPMDVAPPIHEEPSAGGDPAGDVIAWLRDYAGERLNSRMMDERRSVAPHVVLDLGNHGVLGLQVPREYGGLGLGYVDSLRVIEQIGAIDQTLAAMTIVHNSLGIAPILGHGPAALKADLLPRLASGRELVAFAITEPSAGSNPQAIRSTAVPDGRDAWRLHGQKSWSGTAGWSSVINVIAQNIDETGQPNGLSAFAVPRGSRGLRIGPEALTLGMRAMVQNTVYLDDVRVTAAQCLGTIGGGMTVAQDAMMQGRLAIGAACVGGIKRCLQLLLRYAERRSVSTGRLADNPLLLERAGALTGAVTAIEALIGHAARRLDQGLHVPGDVLIVCKTAGSEWLWQAADDLVQFLGGRGYIETNVAAQLLRDARVTRILEGPTEALTMFLGSRAVNDSGPLHRFVADVLGASAVSARLAEVVGELSAVAAAHVDAGSGVDARRHVYALAGQVTTDALLLAAMPADATAANRAWAEQRLAASSADAVTRARGGVRLTAAALADAVGSFTASIGDVEQTLPGEDHDLDAMLLRTRGEPAPVAGPLQPAPAAPPQEAAASQPLQVSVDAQAIEQFIVRHLAKALKLPESAIDPERSVFDNGVDSVTAVMLAVSLEDFLGTDCNPELLYDVPVIRRFAARLAGRRLGATSRTDPGGSIEGAATSA